MMAQGRDYRGDDPAAEERLWQQPAVQGEIARQIRLLGTVGAIAQFDDRSVAALRRSLRAS